MSTTTCPIFYPSEEEFADFSSYVKLLESSVTSVGVCKVVPPASWPKPTIKENLVIQNAIQQQTTGSGGAFLIHLFERPEQWNVASFREFALKHQCPTPGLTCSPENYNSQYQEAYNALEHVLDRERRFWREILLCSQGGPIYGADIPGGFFKEEQGAWNLSNLDNALSCLPSRVSGVNTPMLYAGTWKSMFAFHCEDYDLYSINYLHAGAPKSWYSIPTAQKARFESLAATYFPEEHRECKEFLRHKNVMFSVKKLKDHALDVVTVVQHPGEFVITFPGGYHAGFNHGYNLAEATNFATEHYLLHHAYQAGYCQCRPDGVRISIPHLERHFLRSRYAGLTGALGCAVAENDSVVRKASKSSYRTYADVPSPILRCACKHSSSKKAVSICKDCHLGYHPACVQEMYAEMFPDFPMDFLALPQCHACCEIDFDAAKAATEVGSYWEDEDEDEDEEEEDYFDGGSEKCGVKETSSSTTGQNCAKSRKRSVGKPAVGVKKEEMASKGRKCFRAGTPSLPQKKQNSATVVDLTADESNDDLDYFREDAETGIRECNYHSSGNPAECRKTEDTKCAEQGSSEDYWSCDSEGSSVASLPG